jgi:hypothetical protein
VSKHIKNIEEIKLMLPDYAMDKLNPDEKKIVDNALEKSPELKTLYEELSGTFNFVSSVKLEEPLAQYWSTLLPRIHEKIEEIQKKKFSAEKLISYWKIFVPVAAVILIALIYFLVINKGSDKTITKKQIEETQKDTVKKIDEIKKDVVKEESKEKVPSKTEKVKNHKPGFKKLPDVKNIDVAQKKEEPESNEDYALEDIEEASVFGEGAGSLDEETESTLDRLSDNEEQLLIQELKNSNL